MQNPNIRSRFLGIGGISTALNLGKFLIPALIIAGAVGYHFYKISSLQNEISTQQKNISTLREDLATSKANQMQLQGTVTSLNTVIERLKQQRREDKARLERLSNQFADAQDQVNSLKEILSEHDLEYLAINKPGLIENRINNGTDDLGKELEEISKYKNEGDN